MYYNYCISIDIYEYGCLCWYCIQYTSVSIVQLYCYGDLFLACLQYLLSGIMAALYSIFINIFSNIFNISLDRFSNNPWNRKPTDIPTQNLKFWTHLSGRLSEKKIFSLIFESAQVLYFFAKKSTLMNTVCTECTNNNCSQKGSLGRAVHHVNLSV